MSQIELTETQRTRLEPTEDHQISRSRNFNNNFSDNFEAKSQTSQYQAGVAKTGKEMFSLKFTFIL